MALAVEASAPPPLVRKIANAILKPLLRSPLSGSAGRRFMILHFAGRKTGRGYDVVVTTHRHKGELLVLTQARWQHNFRGGADVEVTLEHQTTRMRGELVEDRDTVARLYAERIAELGVKEAQRALGLKIHTPEPPTAEELRPLAAATHLAVIRLTP